ncbi:hypothetical protein E2I00_006851, partial [Balaenoptera physalus]
MNSAEINSNHGILAQMTTSSGSNNILIKTTGGPKQKIKEWESLHLCFGGPPVSSQGGNKVLKVQLSPAQRVSSGEADNIPERVELSGFGAV